MKKKDKIIYLRIVEDCIEYKIMSYKEEQFVPKNLFVALLKTRYKLNKLKN